MANTPASQSVHRRPTEEIGPRGKSLQWVYTATIRNLLPSRAGPPRQLRHAIAKRVFPRAKCPVMATKGNIEKLVASL